MRSTKAFSEGAGVCTIVEDVEYWDVEVVVIDVEVQ